MTSRTAAYRIGEVAVLSVLAAWWMRAAWADPSHVYFGNPGDSSLLGWYLEHTAWAIRHLHNPFVTDRMQYPVPVNLMVNTSVVAVGALLAPVTWVAGPIVSYNLAVLVGLVGTAALTSVALLRLTGNRWASSVGGLLFGMSSFMTMNARGHLQASFLVCFPTAAILVHEALARQRWPWWLTGVALGVVATVQLLVSTEMLAILVMAVLGTVALAAMIAPPEAVRRRWRYAALVAASGAVTFAVLSAWPLWVLFLGPSTFHGPVWATDVFVTDVGNLLTPVLRWYDPPGAEQVWRSFTGSEESNGYLGVAIIALTVVGLVISHRRRLAAGAAALLAAALVVSFGPSLHVGGKLIQAPLLPGRLLARLPLLDSLLPSRLAAVVFAGAALLVTLALAELPAIRAAGRPWSLAALGAVAMAALLTTAPTPHPATAPVELPAFFSSQVTSAIPRDAPVLVLPYCGDDLVVQALDWQAQARMWFRMPDGAAFVTGSDGGPQFGPPQDALSRAFGQIQAGNPVPQDPGTVAAVRAELASLRIHYAVLGPAPHAAELEQFMSDVANTPGEQVQGVVLWHLP